MASQECKRHRFNPWVGKIPCRRKWQPTPFCLKNPVDRGTWQATVHGDHKESDKVNCLHALCPVSRLMAAPKVKSLPAMWETWVQSLGQEDPLEKENVTQCSILAWKIPWTKEPGDLQSMGSQRVGHHWVTNTHSTLFILFLLFVLELLSDCFDNKASHHQHAGPFTFLLKT